MEMPRPAPRGFGAASFGRRPSAKPMPSSSLSPRFGGGVAPGLGPGPGPGEGGAGSGGGVLGIASGGGVFGGPGVGGAGLGAGPSWALPSGLPSGFAASSSAPAPSADLSSFDFSLSLLELFELLELLELRELERLSESLPESEL